MAEVCDEVGEVLRELGHQAQRYADAGIDPAMTPRQLLAAARTRQLELIVAGRETIEAMLPGSGDKQTFGRVLVQLPGKPEEQEEAIARLFFRFKRLTPGRLYTATPDHAKARQLPISLD